MKNIVRQLLVLGLLGIAACGQDQSNQDVVDLSDVHDVMTDEGQVASDVADAQDKDLTLSDIFDALDEDLPSSDAVSDSCASPLEPADSLCDAAWTCISGCDQAQDKATCVSECKSRLGIGGQERYGALETCMNDNCQDAGDASARQSCAETECASELARCLNPCLAA